MKKKQTISSSYQPIENELNIDTEIKKIFPNICSKKNVILKKVRPCEKKTAKKIAVCFSGGPAPGGHNVIHHIKTVCGTNHTLIGIKNGPQGLLNEEFIELTKHRISEYYNKGGFHLLGTDRTKITTSQQFNKVRQIVVKHQINGIIFIGGDDTHTNVIFLAEVLFDLNCSVVGVPKTIDGDLSYPPYLPTPFGFSTAVELYSQLVNNLILDTKSSKKYWHMVKLMGRTSSHVALGVGNQTKPDLTIISERFIKSKTTLADLVTTITDKIYQNYKQNKAYGVICFPEGIFEFLVDIKALISELNQILAAKNISKSSLFTRLSIQNKRVFLKLPQYIQNQLLLDRDPRGNIRVSQIDSQQCLIELCQQRLISLKIAKNIRFIPHFYGYEGRCQSPNLYDQQLSNTLGEIAAELILENHTGYMAAYNPTKKDNECFAIPLIAMLIEEQRHGKRTVVVRKSLVS